MLSFQDGHWCGMVEPTSASSSSATSNSSDPEHASKAPETLPGGVRDPAARPLPTGS
jgi:hypothetical protein